MAKTLILYYSLTGNVAKAAQETAQTLEADLCEVKEVKKRGMVSAFVPGVVQARTAKQTPIQPLGTNLQDYDHFVLMAPVWAGYPAPAINSVVPLLPKGKTADVLLVSGSGAGHTEKLTHALQQAALTVGNASTRKPVEDSPAQ